MVCLVLLSLLSFSWKTSSMIPAPRKNFLRTWRSKTRNLSPLFDKGSKSTWSLRSLDWVARCLNGKRFVNSLWERLTRKSGNDYNEEDFEEEEEEEEVTTKDDLFGSDSDEEGPSEKKKSTDLRDENEKWNQEKIDKKVKEMLSKRGTKVSAFPFPLLTLFRPTTRDNTTKTLSSLEKSQKISTISWLSISTSLTSYTTWFLPQPLFPSNSGLRPTTCWLVSSTASWTTLPLSCTKLRMNSKPILVQMPRSLRCLPAWYLVTCSTR